MFDMKALARLDLRIIPLVLALMLVSLLVLSSVTGEGPFWTPVVKSQLRWYCLGFVVFALFAAIDYRRLRDFAPLLYGITLVILAGLFFVSPIQNVHRWYRIPGVMSIQPSEQAKLILILALGWFLERKEATIGRLKTALQMCLIAGAMFLLILKQPDLGTALVLFPITLVMGYLAGIHPGVTKAMVGIGCAMLAISALFFLGIVSHEAMRPYCTTILKEYQYERLNPNTYHQRASQIAIAIGGMTGAGWKQGEFSSRKWLPAAHTDSVFAAFGEEFGVVGLVLLLFLFYALIYCSFQVAALARDPFGRLLAAGLAAYLAMHVLVNIAMMCALLPITGVPLIFVTYGGSSLLTSMAALGLLQSIYSRRFMF
jgi:rod shape determining protein RodA